MLFDSRLKEYNQIYSEAYPKKLLHQEKRVRAALVEELVVGYLSPTKSSIYIAASQWEGIGVANIK